MNDITQRIDRTTFITKDRLKTIIPPPKSVKIELSARCNFRCKFCGLMAREKQPIKDMDFELFKKITKEMLNIGVEEIGVFHMGESTINPDLLEKSILYLKKIGIPYVFLTSNGSLVTSEISERIMKSGLNSLKWSINYCNEKDFVTITSASPTVFKTILNNIKETYKIRTEKGYKTMLSASSIEYDNEQHNKMELFLNENIIPYVDKHYWLPLYSMANFNNKMEFIPTIGNQGRLGSLRDPLPCWCLFTEGHVRVNGGLTTCAFDNNGEFEIGNLNNKSFMEVWNSETFQKIRELHLKKDVRGTQCEKCNMYNH